MKSREMLDTLRKSAINLFLNSHYLSLSTTKGKNPWTTPLYFASDKKYNLFFISRKDTLHSINIYKNSNVSFSIFNSEDHSFTAQGIQASGTASEVKLQEVPHAIRTIYKKKYPDLKQFKKKKPPIKNFTGLINCRIYKIVIDKLYLLDPDNPDMDTRIEVKLL